MKFIQYFWLFSICLSHLMLFSMELEPLLGRTTNSHELVQNIKTCIENKDYKELIKLEQSLWKYDSATLQTLKTIDLDTRSKEASDQVRKEKSYVQCGNILKQFPHSWHAIGSVAFGGSAAFVYILAGGHNTTIAIGSLCSGPAAFISSCIVSCLFKNKCLRTQTNLETIQRLQAHKRYLEQEENQKSIKILVI